MDNLRPIVFDDAAPIRIPVKIEGVWYALCEPSEAAVREFQNAGMAGIELDLSNIDVTSPQSIKDSLRNAIKGLDPTKVGAVRSVLVGHCLHHCEYDETTNDFKLGEDGKPIIGASVGASMIEGLAPRIVTPLFSKAKEIGELDKLAAENPFQGDEQKATVA